MRTAICMALAMLLIIIGNTTGHCAQDDSGLRLIDAVLEGNHQAVDKALKAGTPVDAENEQGETALIWACFKGDTASVSLLLDKGANPAKASKAGITPIIAAGSFGHAEIVKTLLARLNYDVSTMEQVLAAYNAATEKGHVETVKLLQDYIQTKTVSKEEDKPADKSMDSLLVQACSVGDIKAAKQLLEEGAKIDGDGTPGGITPLFVAVAGGHQEVANLLLEKGVDVNVGVKENWTPFIACCHFGRPDLAEKMIEKGADVDARTKDGWSGLELASANKHPETVTVVMKRLMTIPWAVVNVKNAEDAGKQLCVRKTPTRSSEKAGCVNVGAEITLNGFWTEDGWAQVIKPYTGWVRADKLDANNIPNKKRGVLLAKSLEGVASPKASRQNREVSQPAHRESPAKESSEGQEAGPQLPVRRHNWR